MAKLKKIDHVAVVVADIDQALKFWHDALGIEVDHVEEVPSQKAEVAFLPVGDSELELVRPTVADTGAARFLLERGGGLHHLCFEVDNLAEMLAVLRAKGIHLINEEPVELPGRKMAFVHPKSTGGVLLELYEITE